MVENRRFVGLHNSLSMDPGQDQQLCIVGELAEGGSMAVAVGISDI